MRAVTPWALVVGRKGTGKSAAAAALAAALGQRGVAVAGVVQEAVEAEGEAVAYRARRLGRPDTALVAWRGAAARAEHEEPFCSFVFDTRAFATVRQWLEGDARDAAVVVIDEVSKLEAAGRGHHDAICGVLDRGVLAVLVVRADQLFAVMERFGLDEPLAVLDTAAGAESHAFVDAVAGAVCPAADGAIARWRAMHAAAEADRVRPGDAGGDRWAPRAARFDRMSRGEGAADGTMEALAPHLHPADVVIDVGAGTGRHTVALARRCAQVVAVEPSAAMRARLAARVAEDGLTNVTIVADPWPLADAVAGDVVLSCHVLYGIEDVVGFVTAMTRAARRGCALVLGLRAPEHAFAALWATIHGAARAPRPAAVEAVAVLRGLGLDPRVEPIAGSERALTFARTDDDDIDEVCRRLALEPSPDARRRVREALAALAPADRDGMHVLGRVGPNVLVWWLAGSERVRSRAEPGSV